MSMKLMVDAMNVKVGNTARKLILIKLADNANDNGECFPSYQHIADACEMSRRSVIDHIDQLIKMGLVKKIERKTRTEKGVINHSNVFILNLSVGKKSSENSALGSENSALGGSENSALGSENSALGGSENSAPITSHSLEPVNEPIKKTYKKNSDDDAPLPEQDPPVQPKKTKTTKRELDFSSWRELGEIEQTVFDDLIGLLRSKRVPINQTVINRTTKQLSQAMQETGYSLNDCIAEWVTAGWASFKSEWLVNRVAPRSQGNTQAVGTALPVAAQGSDFIHKHTDRDWAL